MRPVSSDGFECQVIAEGDDVVFIGRMVCEVKKTGRDIETAFAPHTTVRDGRITRYHPYEDTYAVAKPRPTSTTDRRPARPDGRTEVTHCHPAGSILLGSAGRAARRAGHRIGRREGAAAWSRADGGRMDIVVVAELDKQRSEESGPGSVVSSTKAVHAAQTNPVGSGIPAEQTLCGMPTAGMQRKAYEPTGPDSWCPQDLGDRRCGTCDAAVHAG